eukprot:611360-Rhodomonas_salina.1
MSGTDLAHAALSLRTCPVLTQLLPPYARAMRCPVLTYRMALPAIAPTFPTNVNLTGTPGSVPVCSYAPPTRTPVLTPPMLLGRLVDLSNSTRLPP